jgi:uncharacterized protein
MFMAILLAVMLATHLFAYYSAISFFSIKSSAGKNTIKIILAALSLSFLISLILSRFWHNIISDIYYAVSAFWIGLFITIVFFFLVAWIFLLVFKIFGFESKFSVGLAALICAMVFSVYGIWAAFNPIVKDVEVKFRDLPDAWKGKTIVQLSDLHLGKINRAFFAEKVVARTNSLNPYIIFITGDLFDGTGSDPDSFLEIINKLHAEKGVYFVTGNHEAYLAKDKVLQALTGTKLVILENKLKVIEGIQIIGIGYPDYGKAQNETDEIRKMPGFDPKKPSILLHHLPTSIEQTEESASDQQTATYWAPNTDFKIAKADGVRLQLSGHSHAGQVFPFGYLTRLLYKGYDYGLHSDGDFNIYTTSGTGTWGPPLRTAKRGEIVSISLVDQP